MMESIKVIVFLLLVLLNPTSCDAMSVSDPMICYILDGILIIYCIVATALFFKEKISHQVATVVVPESVGGIYQELGQDKNADPYEVLEPFKKKKRRKKKRPEAAQSNREEAVPVPGTSSALPS